MHVTRFGRSRRVGVVSKEAHIVVDSERLQWGIYVRCTGGIIDTVVHCLDVTRSHSQATISFQVNARGEQERGAVYALYWLLGDWLPASKPTGGGQG